MSDKSAYAKQLESLVMTDEQVIAQIDRCIGDGTPINISTMRRGLEILLYERHERTKAQHLATGLEPLKGTQAKVYDFVVAYIAQHGYSPTSREIAKGLNLTIAPIHEHLVRLEKKGYISRGKPGQVRAIRITGAREVAPCGS